MSQDLKDKEKPLCDLSYRAFQAEKNAKALRRIGPCIITEQRGQCCWSRRPVVGIAAPEVGQMGRGQVHCSTSIVLLFNVLQGYVPSTNPFPLVSP